MAIYDLLSAETVNSVLAGSEQTLQVSLVPGGEPSLDLTSCRLRPLQTGFYHVGVQVGHVWLPWLDF